MLIISEVLVAFPALLQGGRGCLKHHVLIGLPPRSGRWTSDLSPFTGEKTSFPGVSQHTFSHGPLAQTGSCAHCWQLRGWKGDYLGGEEDLHVAVCHMPLAMEVVNQPKGMSPLSIPVHSPGGYYQSISAIHAC